MTAHPQRGRRRALSAIPDRRWARFVLGIVCVAGGGVLTLRPFTSLAVLVAFVAGVFVAAGVAELAAARDAARARLSAAVGLGWVGAGALVVAWAGITIHALAIVAGAGMATGGASRLMGVGRARGADRVSEALIGLSSVIFGALALSWPDVTVLVIALLVGARTVIFGFGQLSVALRPARRHGRRWRAGRLDRWLRLMGAVAAVLTALALLGVSVMLHRSSASAEAFYTPPSSVPARPGVLVRSEPFTRGIPADARAWRILYTTTRNRGVPAVASGLVVVSRDPPAGPRPVIAWAHGTAGVSSDCAPSLLSSRLNSAVIPGLHQIIKRGWILVATDYIGLGTAGPHPYLIGQGEARSVLDAVRAAKELPELSVAPQTVVWGHSQGGHAALWTGQLARSYAPNAHVIGVVAIAPASDLAPIVDHVKDTLEGRVIGSYIVSAYSAAYPDVSFDRYVRPAARVIVREMAHRCLDIPEAVPSVLTALASRQALFAANPLSGALGRRLRENTPTGKIEAPVLIAQGLWDPLIAPGIQERYVKERCAAGQSLQYRTYARRDHLSILVDPAFVSELLSWTEDRLQGKPAPNGCSRAST